jgi:hypothetical protein
MTYLITAAAIRQKMTPMTVAPSLWTRKGKP